MTTFNTVEELMQVLDANPHLLEGLRSWLLTRELLDLPETVARLATRVDQIVEQLTRLTERVGQLIEQQELTNHRLDQLTEQQEQTNHRLDQIVDDLGRLKNVGTITATREQAEVIAEFVGLHCQKQLPRNEIIALSRNQEIPEIRSGDLMSFRRADLIMEATDDDGGLHYIAVEASFTADERDTRRAVRNAEYLTRFTGRPAQAVIAATRIDHRIQAVLDPERVVWYQLEDDVSD
jgi:vacuolar-type H+-ATPase subunit I/STV1